MKSILQAGLLSMVSAAIFSGSSASAARTERKEVAGRVILCDVWSPGFVADQCNNPQALPNAVLKVRREGGGRATKVYANAKGRFSTSRIPGRYIVEIDDSYQRLHETSTGCSLTSFPETTYEKTLIVGPRNKKKDLYFEERCPV